MGIDKQRSQENSLDKTKVVQVRIRLKKEVHEKLKHLAKRYDVPLNEIISLLTSKLLGRKPDILDLICNSALLKDPNVSQSMRKINSAYSSLRLESPSNGEKFLEKSEKFINEANNLIKFLQDKEK